VKHLNTFYCRVELPTAKRCFLLYHHVLNFFSFIPGR